jgi:hypothetical protein
MTRRFDVFVSHSSVDTLWVQRLTADLERYEVSVWSAETQTRPDDQPDDQPGDKSHGQARSGPGSGPDALEQGLDTCGAVVLVVSPESLASGWVAETHARALALAQRKDAALHLIPVLLHAVELPAFLAQRSWVEFREPDGYADGVWHVVWGITGEKPAQVLVLEAPDTAAPVPAALADTAPARAASSTGPKSPHAADQARSRRAITQP